MSLKKKLLLANELGVGATFLIISSGNIYNTYKISVYDYKYTPWYWTTSFFIGSTVASIVKGCVYGLIWPVFWTHAYLKSRRTFREEYYIREFGYVDQNSLMPHFIPMWHLMKNTWPNHKRDIRVE